MDEGGLEFHNMGIKDDLSKEDFLNSKIISVGSHRST